MTRAKVMRVSLAAVVQGVLITAGLAAASAAGASSAGASSTGASSAAASPDTITTVAGGVGGPDAALSVALTPCGLSYANGALLVGTGGAIRRIDPTTDWLTNVAGNGAAGDAAGSPPATGRSLGGACDVATDAHGNLVFAADTPTQHGDAGSQVDVVPKSNGAFYGRHMTAGHRYTIDTIESDGPIVDIEPDSQGNLLLSVDGATVVHGEGSGGAHVYVLAEKTGTFYGQRMTAGRQYTIAGETNRNTKPHDNQLAVGAWLGGHVGNLRFDHNGNIVLADPTDPPNGGYPVHSGTNVPSSLVLVLAEKAGTFYGMKMRPQRIYLLAGNITKHGNSGNGLPGPNASLFAADALTLDRHGNVLIADWGQVRVVAASTGTFYGIKMRAYDIYTIAGTTEQNVSRTIAYTGNGGPARKADFATDAIAVDGSGNVLLGSNTGRILAIAVRTGIFYRIRMNVGDIYTIAGNSAGSGIGGGGPVGHSGDGGPATSAELDANGVSYDRPLGLIVIPDVGGRFATVRVVAIKAGTYFGKAIKAGGIDKIAAGHGPVRSGLPGTAATFFVNPPELAATPQGNLVVPGQGLNVVQLIAARSGSFFGRVMRVGGFYTIAGTGMAGYSGDGGPATSAKLNGVSYTAVDGAGNALLSDAGRVRVIAASSGTFYGQHMTVGDIYTIAGDGTVTSSGNGGPARSATLYPGALTLDGAGNVLVSDRVGCEIRVIAARPGTFYGQPMTAGDSYAIAGDGSCTGPTTSGALATSVPAVAVGVAIGSGGSVVYTDQGFVYVVPKTAGTFYGQSMRAGHVYVIGGGGRTFGDGGPATNADLFLEGLATTPAGAILVADANNLRIRAIAP